MDNKDFTPEKIGRGIWHSWHLTSYKAETKEDFSVIFEFILIYVEAMICNKCSEHAKNYINRTGMEIITILAKKDISFSETSLHFNEWLNNFHREANTHAGKYSPTNEEIANFYMNLQKCTEDCNH
jgi:hypothetical protein